MSNWNRKELWRKFGKNFMVEVSRHEEPTTDSGCFDSEGPHRWCVYAYIYPTHPHFAAFDGTEAMWQDATSCLPLHGGPSFCRKHLNGKGEVTSYQVGADYHHLHDWHFTQFAGPGEASEVFADAQRLFDVLTKLATVAPEAAHRASVSALEALMASLGNTGEALRNAEAERDALRAALVRVLDTHEREAKAYLTARVASENFSRRSAKADEHAHLQAAMEASKAEKEARELLAAMKGTQA